MTGSVVVVSITLQEDITATHAENSDHSERVMSQLLLLKMTGLWKSSILRKRNKLSYLVIGLAAVANVTFLEGTRVTHVVKTANLKQSRHRRLPNTPLLHPGGTNLLEPTNQHHVQGTFPAALWLGAPFFLHLAK